MAVGTTGVVDADTGDQKSGEVAAVGSAQDSSYWQENGQMPSPAAKEAVRRMLR